MIKKIKPLLIFIIITFIIIFLYIFFNKTNKKINKLTNPIVEQSSYQINTDRPFGPDRFNINNSSQSEGYELKKVDSNNNGISDEEPLELKLNPDSLDTDGDGIFDIDEINITKTDPTKKDTDGDGYNDLDELRAGYNPLGEGKLVN